MRYNYHYNNSEEPYRAKSQRGQIFSVIYIKYNIEKIVSIYNKKYTKITRKGRGMINSAIPTLC